MTPIERSGDGEWQPFHPAPHFTSVIAGAGSSDSMCSSNNMRTPIHVNYTYLSIYVEIYPFHGQRMMCRLKTYADEFLGIEFPFLTMTERTCTWHLLTLPAWNRPSLPG